ncbi:MAG: elongation factor P maturation arginine rhamnosyltransferase EarP [Betaproteobacteria bacterium]
MSPAGITCDIFCRVVDNFGDIGVTWRLARQLTQEHGVKVRLVVDDLNSFARIESALDASLAQQDICGVHVILWVAALEIIPAQLVIESFAVNLPEPYIALMEAAAKPPVWINLEYLTAETWVGGHHLLPSPHPKYALIKHFFFPGFLPNTGGLIREQNLLKDFATCVNRRESEKLSVFLFCYDNAATENLINAFGKTACAVRCTVPEGTLADRIGGIYRASEAPALEIIPFVDQQQFDHLLWRHDVLFVRGEDSFVRAQWAAKPFIWHIYPQGDHAHLKKLDAFLALYCDGLAAEVADAVHSLWHAWNTQDRDHIEVCWLRFCEHLPTLRIHAKIWATRLAKMPDLAANLLSFYQKNIKIQGFAGFNGPAS